MNRWYVRTLERSLVNQAGGINLSDTNDGATAEVLLSIRQGHERRHDRAKTDTVSVLAVDGMIQDILALRSGNRDRIINVLSRPEGLGHGLIAHAIPLLAVDPVADHAMFALRKVAEERVGELLDALLDPNQDYAVRRRLARVFSVGVSQRAADGLMLALDDPRFDVRFQSGRSLAAILERNPRIRIDSSGSRRWCSGKWPSAGRSGKAGACSTGVAGESPLDEFVRDRAGQSLAHVFTLLSLVLPREPLQIAFRSLHSDDRQLRGTALEYLEGVLPSTIRQRLWPFLVYRRGSRLIQKREEIFANLLRSSSSPTLLAIAGATRQGAELGGP